MLENIDRPQLIKWVAYYLIVGGILTICSGVLLAGAGGLAGMVGVMGLGTGAAVGDPEAAGELAAASAGLGIIGVLAVIAGVASIIVGPAMAIVGVGLLRKQPWSRMGTVVVVAISLITSLLFVFSGSGLLQVVFVIVDAVIIYLFLNDPRIKQELGG